MIHGKIEAYTKVSRQEWLADCDDQWDIDQINARFDMWDAERKSLVRFLVYDQPYSVKQYVCVSAAIPNVVLTAELIDHHVPIWWQSGKVYISITGVEDMAFEKVGYSGGNKETFYASQKRQTMQQ